MQRADLTTYWEENSDEIARLITAGIVHGFGPRSGRIDILRIICDEAEALERLAEVRRAESLIRESPGDLLGDASRNIFLEALETGRCWTRAAADLVLFNKGLKLAWRSRMNGSNGNRQRPAV